MDSVILNNGLKMPIIGLGTYARKFEPGQYKQAVEWAIEAGYRHIDTASCYKNEEEVGEGIDNKIKQGLVSREDLFVTTKLWNDRHAEKDVIPSLKESLSKLKLDYIDLYLIHWPLSVDSQGVDTGVDYVETWRGMESALKEGFTRSIGVSNFNEQQLERLMQSATVKPVVNQVEINPTLTQEALVDYCKKCSIVPVAYTPLGLISEARPEFNGKDVIKTDPKLGEIAEKYGKTRAQIALRYLESLMPENKVIMAAYLRPNVVAIQTGLGPYHVARVGCFVAFYDRPTTVAEIQRGIPVLPKSFTKSRIEENLNIFDFTLSDEDMAVVRSYNINHRCVPGTAFKNFNFYPF